MASVSAPHLPSHSPYKDQNHRKSPFISSRHLQSFRKSPALLHLPIFSSPLHRVSESTVCRCQSQSDSVSPSESDGNTRWNSVFQDIVKGAIKRIEDYFNSNRENRNENVDLEEKEKVNDEVQDWDWERWKKHFQEVEDHEKLVSHLKSQIGNAVYREEYEDASKLKVAMAAAATNDIVGRVITHFNKAIEEERYQDAAYFRDNAGAGLMGWWAGISEESDDPYGRIIHIGVEHGRYLARSFSPRHLATATPGVPLFEIFLTVGSKGEYKQQAVYLKRNGRMFEFSTGSSKLLDPSNNRSQLNESTDMENEHSATSTEDTEDRDDDSDTTEELAGVKDVLRNMMPRDVTVLKVTAPENATKDFISDFIEQIVEEEEEEGEEEEDVDVDDDDDDDDDDGVVDDDEEEEEDGDEDEDDGDEDEDDGDEDDDDDLVLVVVDEDEENDSELESVDTEDGEDVKPESHQGKVEIETDVDGDGDNVKKQSKIPFEVLISGRPRKQSSSKHAKKLVRVPARLEKKDRSSFTFSVEKDEKQEAAGSKVHALADNSATGQRSISHVMSDLAKFAINREKIPMKVLKDVEELISLTLDQAKTRQPLSGTTTFKRIETSASSDILNGLYVGSHGLHTSEVIHLTRKFGQWKEDGVKQKRSSLEFYEYVEALKLTGDPYVPAGQVAFRAKVGKQYQLPHKGIIPEEFGVVARYKGQGRLAEPGFKNPRWVDGELVILDGKYIKEGPVVGFVYWAPDYHFLVFFNRVKLPE